MDYPKACRLCQATPGRFEIVGEFVFGGHSDQHFYECPRCDVAFLFPPLDEKDEAKFYAKEFEKFMESRTGEGGGWSGPEAHIAANHEQVARRMPYLEGELSRPGMRVLEIGCSSGFMLLPMKERGIDVMGVEPSGGFTDFLRSQGIPVFDSLDEFQSHSGAAGKLDLITHFFLFEHVRDPASFLRHALSLLKPGGKMFFEVPSRSDPLVTIYDIPEFHKFYWSVAHNWYFNKPSLEFVLGQLGCQYQLIPEQRYDLSNHFWWALEGRPGGMGRYSGKITPELDQAYKESMRTTGHCDTYFVWVQRED